MAVICSRSERSISCRVQNRRERLAGEGCAPRRLSFGYLCRETMFSVAEFTIYCLHFPPCSAGDLSLFISLLLSSGRKETLTLFPPGLIQGSACMHARFRLAFSANSSQKPKASFARYYASPVYPLAFAHPQEPRRENPLSDWLAGWQGKTGRITVCTVEGVLAASMSCVSRSSRPTCVLSPSPSPFKYGRVPAAGGRQSSFFSISCRCAQNEDPPSSSSSK